MTNARLRLAFAGETPFEHGGTPGLAWGNPWFPHEPLLKKGARGGNMVSSATKPLVPPWTPSSKRAQRHRVPPSP